MNPRYRRYARILKRALLVVGIYLVVAWAFLQIGPRQAIVDFFEIWPTFSTLVIQLLFGFAFLIAQFAGLMWFLSRGNRYTIYPGEYDKSFEDVRGQPAAVRSTMEVLRLFQGFKDFKQMGGYPPHGILFEGPPGTGKTLMAKAVAGASGVPFIYASGSGFVSMWLGMGNLMVRRTFTKARNLSDKYGGAVVFIDELDALGGSRGAVSQRFEPTPPEERPNRVVFGGMGQGSTMVNELLVQMDGLIMPRGLWRHVKRMLHLGRPKIPFYNILIIGATNRAATLDAALLRPGRFDRKIHVGLPDYEGREDIANYYLAKVRHEPIDIKRLAKMTVGYSPATIQNIVNEALIFALQDGRDALRWDDLWEAKLTEEIGLKQPVKYPEREKISVATHEGAHAVASYILQRDDRQIQVITIQKREDTLGLVHGQPVEETHSLTQKQALAQLQVSLAGLVSEEIWFGEISNGAASDLANATRLAAAYVGIWGMGRSLVSIAGMGAAKPDWDPVRAVLSDADRRSEVEALLNDCKDGVRNLLLKKRRVVEGVRDALLEREELIGDEIEMLMAELGEREPINIPVGAPVAVDGNGGMSAPGGQQGDGQGGNGQGSGAPPPPPPPR